MYKKIFSMAALAAASATPLFVGCSSSTTETPGGPSTTDAGPTTDGSGSSSGGGRDTGTPDSHVPVQQVPPPGSPVLQSETANIVAVTKDDQIIFLDSTASSVNAVALAGAASATLIAPTQNGSTGFPYLTVLDDAVLNWVNVT